MWPMLANLCRHIVYAREFAGELEDPYRDFQGHVSPITQGAPGVSAKGNPLPGEDAIGSARRNE